MVESDKRQVGGNHYKKHSIQPFDVMRIYFSPEELTGYYWGSMLKYMLRWKDKGGVEDLKKAKHYLEKLIESKEGVSVRSAEASVRNPRGEVEA